MKSIWTSSESQAILPSTQKTPDLQELIGDPNHDQQKLQPTLKPSKMGIWFNRQARHQGSKSRKPLQTLKWKKPEKESYKSPPAKDDIHVGWRYLPPPAEEIWLFPRIQREVARTKAGSGTLSGGEGKGSTQRSGHSRLLNFRYINTRHFLHSSVHVSI